MICGISGITWMNPSDIYDTNHIISITQASTESWTKWSYEIIITRYSPRGEINFRVEFSDENNMNARDTRTSPLFQFSSDHKDALLLRKPKIISRISSRSRLEIRLIQPRVLANGCDSEWWGGSMEWPNSFTVSLHRPNGRQYACCYCCVGDCQWPHDDVIKWKHFPRYWPFVRGIHRSRWIPHTKASDAELWCFLWSTPE